MKDFELDTSKEGYVFTSYGKEKYLKDTIVCALTIKRFDKNRPIALYCSEEHKVLLKQWHLESFFEVVEVLPTENQSIVGFKHNLHLFMPFQRNIYLDSDMIFCKNPDSMWKMFSLYPFTITGQESADVFFGSKKSVGILGDIIFRRRQRTLKTFGLTHLFRVQTGIMYSADREVAKEVCELARYYLSQKDKTHFVSRTQEKGRKHETCEWSLGMAMSKLNMYVFPWFNGYESTQLDYIFGLVNHDEDFSEVKVKYYCNPFIQSLRGIASNKIRNFILACLSILPRSKDYIWVKPYVLHFGWSHQKSYFNKFAKFQWELFYSQHLNEKSIKLSESKNEAVYETAESLKS